MISIFSDFVYLLVVLLDLIGLILVLECFFYFVPIASLNWARKVFFYLTFPVLSWSDRFFSVRMGLFNSRGLLTALLLWSISYFGMPWLILLSYSLRG